MRNESKIKQLSNKVEHSNLIAIWWTLKSARAQSLTFSNARETFHKLYNLIAGCMIMKFG